MTHFDCWDLSAYEGMFSVISGMIFIVCMVVGKALLNFTFVLHSLNVAASEDSLYEPQYPFLSHTFFYYVLSSTVFEHHSCDSWMLVQCCFSVLYACGHCIIVTTATSRSCFLVLPFTLGSGVIPPCQKNVKSQAPNSL